MISTSKPDYGNTPASGSRPQFHYEAGENARPIATIITPYFNTGAIFMETVRAIKQMSVPYWEWVIVDDGSTDRDSLAQLGSVAASDTRIRVIHQPNLGPSAARNRAAREATTPYLLQVDADDLVEPTFLEKAIWLLETQPQFDIAGSYNVTFGTTRLLWQNGFQQYEKTLTSENMMTNLAVIRRSAYFAAGGHDESIAKGHEDWDFWLNMAEAGLWGYTIPEFLTWYRMSPGSRSSETNLDAKKLKAFHQWLKRKHSGLHSRFPHPTFTDGQSQPWASVSDEIPVNNLLDKPTGVKRVLFLVPWLVIGGADKFNLDLVKMLSRRGYEFTIATTVPSDNSWLHEFAAVTPDIFCLDRFLQPADYPRFLRYLIESRLIDAVLISNSEMGYLLAPYLRAHYPHLAMLDYAHVEEEHWKNGGYPGMALRVGRQLDLNITSSEYLKKWLTDHGGDPRRIRVTHTNIDTEDWNPARYDIATTRKMLGITPSTPIILFVGRVVDQKRPLVWAEIIRRVALRERNFVALVIGDGSLLPAMQDFVRKHRINQVRFLGAQRNQEVREIMAASDILLLPSQYEGLALVLFECMAMQMVPVATSFGGHPELVTPDCGFLISSGPGDVDEYVDAVVRLLREPERRRDTMRLGRERVVSHFSLEHMGEDMYRFIEEAQQLARARNTEVVDVQAAVFSAEVAIENGRLERLADTLWFAVQSAGVARKKATIRSPMDVLRYGRQQILPIGSQRYEVYKHIRRTVFPRGHYTDGEVFVPSTSRRAVIQSVATVAAESETQSAMLPVGGVMDNRVESKLLDSPDHGALAPKGLTLAPGVLLSPESVKSDVSAEPLIREQ